MPLKTALRSYTKADWWLALILLCGVVAGVLSFVALGWSMGSSSAKRDFQADLDRSAKVLATYSQGIASAQGRVAELEGQLKAKTAIREQEGAEIKSEIAIVASPDRSCLSPATARVLRRAISRANERLAQAQNPGIFTPTPSADTAVAAVEEYRAEEAATERATAEWQTIMMQRYEQVSENLLALHRLVRANPNTEIVEGK